MIDEYKKKLISNMNSLIRMFFEDEILNSESGDFFIKIIHCSWVWLKKYYRMTKL